jgi:pSer/pThr/pTyr-binding forkhead associated (FHA) protein
MPPSDSIASFLIEYRRKGREAFVSRHKNPILLVRPVKPEGSADGYQASFYTDTYQVHTDAFVGAWSDEELDAAAKIEGLRVLEVVKAPDNPWRARISLGRARNNDLVVPAPSVSKLHAYFTMHEEGQVSVGDAGSHNGTHVNDKRLGTGETVVLQPGDTLLFGKVSAIYHLPDSLCEFFATLFTK